MRSQSRGIGSADNGSAGVRHRFIATGSTGLVGHLFPFFHFQGLTLRLAVCSPYMFAFVSIHISMQILPKCAPLAS